MHADGCLHGFYESLFNQFAQIVPKFLVAEFALQACAVQAPEMAGTCLHGFGHGIYDAYGFEEGMEICKNMPSWEEGYACISGLWMKGHPDISVTRAEDMRNCAMPSVHACECFKAALFFQNPSHFLNSATQRDVEHCFQVFADRAQSTQFLRNLEYMGARPRSVMQNSSALGSHASDGEATGGNDQGYLLGCIYGAMTRRVHNTLENSFLCEVLVTQKQRLICVDGWMRGMFLWYDDDAREAACRAQFEDERYRVPRAVPLTQEQRQELLDRCLPRARAPILDPTLDWSLFYDLP
eukprot:TRINITY_DN1382_c0_g1_i3.p1 TRINITY_DN1382_c0_g1~~TRINITY_DN1382_c0_g1_i3.p1  ORF type:complete len:296 (+),score=43.10 TRINITY_DN1382_c0_g1_i3:642-1529(+)